MQVVNIAIFVFVVLMVGVLGCLAMGSLKFALICLALFNATSVALCYIKPSTVRR